MPEDKDCILNDLIKLLPHGEAKIKWADKKILLIEEIRTQAKIVKPTTDK